MPGWQLKWFAEETASSRHVCGAADILQDYTPAALQPLIGQQLGTAVYIIARLAFLASVLTLYPLMVCLFVTSATWHAAHTLDSIHSVVCRCFPHVTGCCA